MAIDWSLFPEAFNRQQENINEQYDFSYVTPELVRGFSRYQALRPEQDVKKANMMKEALKNIEGEVKSRRAQQWKNKMDADKMASEVLSAVNEPEDIVPETEEQKDYEAQQRHWMPEEDKNLRRYTIGERTPDETQYERLQRHWSAPEDKDLPRYEIGVPMEDPGMTDEERAELETEILREKFGSDYDDYKRAYDIYGKMNPYEQMIQAGKQSSYWDPEIGKIYTDAGERIRNDRITAWKEALDGESMLQRQAMDMFKQTGLSRYRREAERRLDRITDLLKNNPRNEGQWFEGYETAEATTPEVASAYGDIEKRILDEGPMSETELMTFINEKGLKGEDVTDLLKQNDAEWEKRYGTDAAVTKRTEEAIRAQSESFKTDQRKRMDRMDQLEDLQNKLADTKAGEATYRLAAETLKKMDLDITQSFDEKAKRAIEQAKNKMVANPSFSTVGAFLLLIGADKLGLTPGDLNALTTDNERKKLIKDAVNALYDTDLNMYNVARTRMLNDLEGVRGIDPDRLSWMRERKPVVVEQNEPAVVSPKAPEAPKQNQEAKKPGNKKTKAKKTETKNVPVNDEEALLKALMGQG